MVPQRRYRSRFDLGFGLMVALASVFLACSFDSPPGPSDCPECDVDKDGTISKQEWLYYLMSHGEIRSLEEADRWTVYEDPGKIRVQHGYGCARGEVVTGTISLKYRGVRIQDRVTVPFDVGDSGTIILNGWDVQYPNGDHHVQGLTTAIFNITEEYNAGEYTLGWEAGGVLSDKNGNDGYKWCYRYTLVFWKRNADALDAVAYHEDLPLIFMGGANDGSGTALVDLPGEFIDPLPVKVYGGPKAVLTRGFGLSWSFTDHHVMQVGFDLGTPPVGGTPIIAGNTITWTSKTVLKDKSTVDAYLAAELITVLSGERVEMWQPREVLHFTGIPPDWVLEPTDMNLKPAQPGGSGCQPVGYSEEYLEFYSVENVPYEYAVPVLTGWDLQYGCTDHEVERIGVYLVEFEYVKEPTATHGTLNYTIFSTLRDDSDNGHSAKYKVSILGFNKLGGGSDK